MTREELIRNLKYTMEKHKNDKVDTFETNISLMCKDVLDYFEQPTSEDCVSREQAKIDVIPNSLYTSEQVIDLLDNLPPVTPTHGTCKDCRHREGIDLDASFCAKHGNSARNDFYCADFEKRGNENE